MEYIVEAVTVGVKNVIRKWVADKHIIPLQITLPTFSLRNFNLKLLGKSFLIWKATIKDR